MHTWSGGYVMDVMLDDQHQNASKPQRISNAATLQHTQTHASFTCCCKVATRCNAHAVCRGHLWSMVRLYTHEHNTNQLHACNRDAIASKEMCFAKMLVAWGFRTRVVFWPSVFCSGRTPLDIFGHFQTMTCMTGRHVPQCMVLPHRQVAAPFLRHHMPTRLQQRSTSPLQSTAAIDTPSTAALDQFTDVALKLADAAAAITVPYFRYDAFLCSPRNLHAHYSLFQHNDTPLQPTVHPWRWIPSQMQAPSQLPTEKQKQPCVRSWHSLFLITVYLVRRLGTPQGRVMSTCGCWIQSTAPRASSQVRAW